MSEEELPGWIARLLRVWVPGEWPPSTWQLERSARLLQGRVCIPGRSPKWHLDGLGQFLFSAPLAKGVKVTFDNLNHTHTLEGTFETPDVIARQCNNGGLWAWHKARFFQPRFDADTDQTDFPAQWLTTFRRGCWLSGCAMEVSMHEKAEWMQGFTKEELEAWNIKF